MARFRKRPVVIDAVLFDGTNHADIQDFVGSDKCSVNANTGAVTISTLEGVMTVSVDDWVIRGVRGEFYPCKPDIFAATYEPVDEPCGECSPRW